jgi:hypothetical protein
MCVYGGSVYIVCCGGCMSDEIIKGGRVGVNSLSLDGMQHVYDDRIALLDILKVFIRNKKSFLLTFFTVLIFGSAIILLRPASYDVAVDIYAPYSYNADGAIYYPLGVSDNNSNSFIAQSEFGKFFYMLDHYLIGTNYAAQGHIEIPVLSFLTSNGDVYSFDANALPINSSEYMLHIDRVSLRGVAAATRELNSTTDALVNLGNSQLVNKKKAITNYIPLLEQQLAKVNSLVDASNHSSGNMFSADPAKSISVLLDETNVLNNQKSILTNWQGFSHGAIRVNKDLVNNYSRLLLNLFVAFFLGILAVAGFETGRRLKYENSGNIN